MSRTAHTTPKQGPVRLPWGGWSQPMLRKSAGVALLLPCLAGYTCGSGPEFTPTAPPLPSAPALHGQPVKGGGYAPKEPGSGPYAGPGHNEPPPSYAEATAGTGHPPYAPAAVGTGGATQRKPAGEAPAALGPGLMLNKKLMRTKKQEAKEEATYWQRRAEKEIYKCFSYEAKIDQIAEAEKFWKKVSEGWFLKRWVGNARLKKERKTKAGKAGQLAAALERAHEHLAKMEVCISHAQKLGSKKEHKALTTSMEKLRGRLLSIRNAMAKHISPWGVGQGAEGQIKPTSSKLGAWVGRLR